jgi:hypothetical protein
MFKAIVTEKVTVPMTAGLWDGGTRETYRLVDLATGDEMPASDDFAPPDNSRKDREIVLKPGYAVIRHSVFCGKDTGLTFYVHPSNAAAMLPASVELPGFEKMVLEATCALKASYGGRDRYEMAKDNSRWEHYRAEYGLADGAAFPTRAQWDEAKASLIAKGLLNKAGAVTVKGRNARGK